MLGSEVSEHTHLRVPTNQELDYVLYIGCFIKYAHAYISTSVCHRLDYMKLNSELSEGDHVLIV